MEALQVQVKTVTLVRGSSGEDGFDLPVLGTSRMGIATLRALRQAGVRVVAAHPHTETKTVSQVNLAGDCCIVFGSEGGGLSAQVLEACSEVVAIPMQHGTDSLNVATASAVFLYEAQRQRGRGEFTEGREGNEEEED